MKLTSLLPIALLLLVANAQLGITDSADTLAARFIEKSDTGRRLLMSQYANDPRVFQVAYGLRRAGKIDMIRQFFHPSVQDLVLYGNQPFYVQVGPLVDGTLDSAYDWFMSCARYQDDDKRDASSTYCHTHVPGWQNKRFFFTPVNRVYPDGTFFINMAADETQTDGVNQAGWSLNAKRLTQFDARDAVSTRVSIQAGAVTSNTWILTPVNSGDSFTIQLARDDPNSDGIVQNGWYLDIGESRSNAMNPDDISNYLIIQAGKPVHTWNIRLGA
jgi:hypothetical protein